MNRYSNCCPPVDSCCSCPCMPQCFAGPAGPPGQQGMPGSTGPAGKSAFESAQEGGYTGTESEFYAALANVSRAILSNTIRANEVVTMAQYQALITLGRIDTSTAYDIIEDVP